MNKIDRNNYTDAKNSFLKFFPDNSIRKVVCRFLASSIDYASAINNNNWNLNLDKNGYFIRFNTGHVYCIEILRNKLLIICDREELKKSIKNRNLPIIFRGYIGKKYTENEYIDEVPDILKKINDSVGCVLNAKDAENVLKYLQESNFTFIRKALNTVIIKQMKEAHSKAAIDFLSDEIIKLPNPNYYIADLPYYNEVIQKQESDIEKAKRISKKRRKENLENSDSRPEKIIVTQTIFYGNQYIVAEVLERAKGRCERCNKPAPFLKDKDNEPFLEVHHKIPLNEGGYDTVENSIALCPNCHRHAHYGKKTY